MIGIVKGLIFPSCTTSSALISMQSNLHFSEPIAGASSDNRRANSLESWGQDANRMAKSELHATFLPFQTIWVKSANVCPKPRFVKLVAAQQSTNAVIIATSAVLVCELGRSWSMTVCPFFLEVIRMTPPYQSSQHVSLGELRYCSVAPY